ncbi:ChaC-like protein [mine drainage metagenome]|uniref:glutathione-specific gamma-glutamylcyclotransferase n=1 Tax=mine drainage metagenome TaxID=410659 RepID=A0A1J5RP09_9ZZZZ
MSFWVFGYGSLMWRPDFPFEESQTALLHGWHRAMCILSTHYRGTPGQPGLVLGLTRGGSCRGIAFRVAEGREAEVQGILHRRELISDVYTPRFAPVRLGDGRRVPAYIFVARPEHAQYAGRLDAAARAALIRQGHGHGGSSRDYLASTLEQLAGMGLGGGELARLLRLVDGKDQTRR